MVQSLTNPPQSAFVARERLLTNLKFANQTATAAQTAKTEHAQVNHPLSPMVQDKLSFNAIRFGNVTNGSVAKEAPRPQSLFDAVKPYAMPAGIVMASTVLGGIVGGPLGAVLAGLGTALLISALQNKAQGIDRLVSLPKNKRPGLEHTASAPSVLTTEKTEFSAETVPTAIETESLAETASELRPNPFKEKRAARLAETIAHDDAPFSTMTGDSVLDEIAPIKNPIDGPFSARKKSHAGVENALHTHTPPSTDTINALEISEMLNTTPASHKKNPVGLDSQTPIKAKNVTFNPFSSKPEVPVFGSASYAANLKKPMVVVALNAKGDPTISVVKPETSSVTDVLPLLGAE